MTPRRPPSSRSAAACGSASASAPGSSLTAMRTAWKVRVATWVRLDHAARGTARFTTETRSAAVRSGLRRRCSTSTRAMRRACRSSPYSASRTAISSAARRPSSSAAVSPSSRIEAHVERLLALE